MFRKCLFLSFVLVLIFGVIACGGGGAAPVEEEEESVGEGANVVFIGSPWRGTIWRIEYDDTLGIHHITDVTPR